MFNLKGLFQQPHTRPNPWLASLVAVAAVSAGALYAGRNNLHFQVGCADTCGPSETDQTFLSAGIRSNTRSGNAEPESTKSENTKSGNTKSGAIYALQLVRKDLPQPAIADSPVVVSSTDPFRDAVNAATAAANLTQTAQAPQEWAAVAQQWQIAIANMQAVPSDHPRHALAQQKATEYGNNLNYATRNAGTAWAVPGTSPTAPTANTGKIRTQTANVPQLGASQTQQPNASEAIEGEGEGPKSNHSKLLLMLLIGGGLAVILSLEPLSFFQKDQEIAEPPKPKPFKQPIPWGLVISNALHDLWEMQPFFNTERVYKMTAATSAHKLQRKLYRRLINLTGDQTVALQLIKDNLQRHPGQSVNWCCEQAILDLEKQHQREHHLKKPPEISDKPVSSESGWT